MVSAVMFRPAASEIRDWIGPCGDCEDGDTDHHCDTRRAEQLPDAALLAAARQELTRETAWDQATSAGYEAILTRAVHLSSVEVTQPSAGDTDGGEVGGPGC